MNGRFDLLLGCFLQQRLWLILLVLACCSLRLEATSYNGLYSTYDVSNDRALYFSGAPSPAPANGDQFNGYIAFGGGLTVPSAATITLSTVGPFGGALTFNADGTSTITLGRDLRCRSDFSFVNAGAINGNGHVLTLTGDLTISSAISFTSDLIIDGGGHRVTLSVSGAISSNGGNVTLRNMDLILANASPFASGGGTSLYFENTNIYLGADVGDVGMPAYFTGLVTVNGQGKILGGSTNTISDDSTLSIGTGVIFQPFADATVLSGQGSTVIFDGCTVDLTAGPTDLSLKKGMVTFKNRVLVLATGQTLKLGDGLSSANNTRVEVLSDAYVIVDGTLLHQPV